MLQDELCKSHKTKSTNTMSRCGKVSGRRQQVKVITALRSEILTAVLMKIQVSLDVIQCQQVNSYISAGTSTHPRTTGPCRCREHASPKCQQLFTIQHGVTFQKILVFESLLSCALALFCYNRKGHPKLVMVISFLIKECLIC